MGSFSNLILPLLGAGLVGYLLGSISFAIIMTKLFIKDDVRNFGSGNAGATNVLRAAGRRASALTFICDFIKCAAKEEENNPASSSLNQVADCRWDKCSPCSEHNTFCNKISEDSDCSSKEECKDISFCYDFFLF